MELRRIRTSRRADGNGLFRWYNDYQLPEAYEGKTMTVRLYNNDEDAARKLNRTENVRPIPPSDPDFKELYGGGGAIRSPSTAVWRTRCTLGGLTALVTPASR